MMIGGRFTALLRRFPVTVAFAALQLWIRSATALDPALHANLLRHFGLDWPQLSTGQLWRLGSRTTPLVFFGDDWLSTIPVLLALGLPAAVGNAQAAHLAATPDAGSSAGGRALLS